MNVKKLLLATVAAFFANGIAYYVLERLLLATYIAERIVAPTGAADPATASQVMPTVAVLVMSLILAYLYPKGYEGGAPLMEGARYGLLMGLFTAVPFGIFFNLMFPMGGGPTAVLIVVYTLEVAAAGLAVGLVHGRPAPE